MNDRTHSSKAHSLQVQLQQQVRGGGSALFLIEKIFLPIFFGADWLGWVHIMYVEYLLAACLAAALAAMQCELFR